MMKHHDYSGKHTVWYEDENGTEHRLDVEFDYNIEKDGIGSYEFWGHMEYDEGDSYMDDITITDISLVREYIKANSKEEIPKGAFDIYQNEKTGEWFYSHARSIDRDGIYSDYCKEKIGEEYDFSLDME